MSLLENLKKNNILVNPESRNKWDLIRELVSVAVKCKYIAANDSSTITDALIEREESMSTGIGNGVAIPHCTSPHVNEIITILAVAPGGIDFDAIDNEVVKIIVLLIVPKNKLSQHIKTLANIAKMLNDESLRNKILSLKTPDSILKTLNNYKNQ